MVMIMKLTEAEIGKYYRIVEIHMNEERIKRMLCMGMYAGADIRIERINHKGKVLLIFACGNLLMMRYQDGEKIEVVLL